MTPRPEKHRVPTRCEHPATAHLAAALVIAAASFAGCAKPELREIPELAPARLRSMCGVDAPPVTGEQARCIAGAVGLDTAEEACAVEPGQDLVRQPIWIVRESCAVVPRCVEVWVRQSDGAIVNRRYLYVFEQAADPAAR
jgi:hypothetical protein